MDNIPGGAISNRPLHFIWIVDCSGSMGIDGKIQALNTAIRNSIPLMQMEADSNPNAEVLMRAIKFSSGAQWHISQPTPVADFKWTNLDADGVTDMGKALKMVAEQLRMPPMDDKALPPVLVLISDGIPTDDFKGGLNALMELPWGKKAVRPSIAIGSDCDNDVLQQFIGHQEIKPLQANKPEALTNYIKWISTVVLKSVTSPVSEVKGSIQTDPIPIYDTDEDDNLDDVADIW